MEILVCFIEFIISYNNKNIKRKSKGYGVALVEGDFSYLIGGIQNPNLHRGVF